MAPTSSKDALTERLGGRGAIGAVVEVFYDRVQADGDPKPYFETTELE